MKNRVIKLCIVCVLFLSVMGVQPVENVSAAACKHQVQACEYRSTVVSCCITRVETEMYCVAGCGYIPGTLHVHESKSHIYLWQTIADNGQSILMVNRCTKCGNTIETKWVYK